MPEQYSEKEFIILQQYIGIPCATLSIVGCLLIILIFLYLYNQKVSNRINRCLPPNTMSRWHTNSTDTKQDVKPVHELVLWIAMCDLVGSIGNMIGMGYPYHSHSTLAGCKIRSVLTSFGGLSSFMFSFILSLIMYLTVFYHRKRARIYDALVDARQRRIVAVALTTVALILALVPYPYYCVLDDGGNTNETGRLFFYVPMVLILCFILFCYARILIYFYRMKTNLEEEEQEQDEPAQDWTIYNNVKLYPAVMLCTVIWGVFRRAYNIVNGGDEPHLFFAVMQVVAYYTYGMSNAIVYIYTIYARKKQLQQSQSQQLSASDANKLEAS